MVGDGFKSFAKDGIKHPPIFLAELQANLSDNSLVLVKDHEEINWSDSSCAGKMWRGYLKFDIRHSIFNILIQHSTFKIRHSKFDIQNSIFSMCSFIRSVQVVGLMSGHP
jgi:hypothetical protein